MRASWHLGPLVGVLAFGLGCNQGGSGKPALALSRAGDAAVGSAGTSGAANASAEAGALMLGMPSAASYAYRLRAGQPAFKRARAAEQAGHWDEVAAACSEALAADPDHLDAHYLLAIARAKLGGTPDQILAPLAIAVGGDFGKWGAPVLVQPALQAFFATPLGVSFRARVDQARAQLAQALARSLIVSASGDYYAVDVDTQRWNRLTRTGGSVVAGLPVPSETKLAYVTRHKSIRDPAKTTKIGVGTVDLASGLTRRAVPVPGASVAKSVRLAFNAKQLHAFVVYATSWFSIADGDPLALRPVAAKEHAGYPANLAGMTWLEVEGRRGRLVRMQMPDIAADWDEHTLASAIKLSPSGRVISVPGPALIDGTTIVWSPDHTQLAFVAQLADAAEACTPGTPTVAAFVADSSTGQARELVRASDGIAVQWVADRRLAIADDRGVEVLELSGTTREPVAIVGADGLLAPRARARCQPAQPADDPTLEDATDPGDL